MLKIHPGEILKEEFLIPLNLSSHALAMALGVPATRISDIVRERRSITADTAARMGRYFGTSAQLWMNLQTAYDLALVEEEKSEELHRIVARSLTLSPAI